jgi:hypothetical protein
LVLIIAVPCSRPIRYSCRNISRLAALGSAAEQQNSICSRSRKVDPIAGAAIDAHLPDTVAAEPLIARIAVGHSINASQHCHPAAEIGQAIEPTLKWVIAGRRHVVFDFSSHLRF